MTDASSKRETVTGRTRSWTLGGFNGSVTLRRCGDEIVAVNGASTVGMNNSSLIPMLKLQKNKVTLTVVSWPGSLV